MNFKQISKLAITLGMVGVFSAANAAQVNDAWNLNLSVANGQGGFNGLSDATNIDHIGVQGFSTITQNVVGGSALGQTFTDSGFLGLSNYFQEGSAFPSSFGMGNAASLYIKFDNITGTLNNDGSIGFDPGSGIVKLFLDTDTDINNGALQLADLSIISPSGGSNLDFFGGTAANSTLDITLAINSTIASGLFTDSNGDDFILPLSFALANTDSLLDPNFNPNPDNSGVVNGNGVSIINVQNAGQVNTRTVPEPASLVLLGLGLFGMGYARKKA